MPVEYSQLDELALITLNRPEALNALSVQVVKDIGEAIDKAAASNARALLITGAGEKAFCAGADISEFMGRTVVEALEAAEFPHQVVQVALVKKLVPVVADTARQPFEQAARMFL